MADKRKLQGEIDRCLKKVQEGVEAFEEIWKKMESTTNANQKEKFEGDLKKEIKKLQRLRDQIKTWVVQSDVKDKQTLTDQRKLIETQMERFKVIEREAKIKAYSKEGLGAMGKVDPKEKEKEEITSWLASSIERLTVQVDKMESELESLSSRKKKLDRDDQSRVDSCRKWLSKHRYHINKLEAVLRLVDNSAVQFDEIQKIRDDVEFYIDSNQEADFEENEFLYDELDLEELGMTIRPDPVASSPTDSNEVESLAGSSSPPMITPPSSHSKHKGDDESKRRTKTNDDSTSAKSNLTLKINNASSSSGTSSNKVPQTPTKLNSTSLTSQTSVETPPPGRSHAATSGLGYAQVASSHHSQTGKPTQSTSSSKASLASGVNGLVTLSSTVTQSSSHSIAMTTMTPSLLSATASSGSLVGPSLLGASHVALTTPSLLTATASSSSSLVGPSSATTVAAHVAVTTQSSFPTQSALSQQQYKLQQQQQQLAAVAAADAETKRLFANGPPHMIQNDSLLLSSLAAKVANLESVDARMTQLDNGPSTTPLQTAAATANDPSNADISSNLLLQSLMRPLSASEQQTMTQLSLATQPLQPSSTTTIRLNPLYGGAPLGPQPLSKDHLVRLAMLDAAYRHLPHPSDSERLRTYFPSNPCPTPSYYPLTPPPMLNSPEFFNKLDTNSLFFIFYYMEGTKAQYLAAKALKQKSWRFHSKYMMWFQRHEEPKTINEEFEQGTYVYFDYEKWSQRKKEDFKFEYRFLEDQDLN